MAALAPPLELFAIQPWNSLIQELIRRAVPGFRPGQTLTSWYRDPLLNEREGGGAQSQHLFALAFDLVGPDLELSDFVFKRAGLVTVAEGDHLHVQLFGPGVLMRAGVRFPVAPTRVTQA